MLCPLRRWMDDQTRGFLAASMELTGDQVFTVQPGQPRRLSHYVVGFQKVFQQGNTVYFPQSSQNGVAFLPTTVRVEVFLLPKIITLRILACAPLALTQ